MITLKDITVKYGENVVYQNFNFTFERGVNVVLGRSGCGKTTLLNVIAHLVEFQGNCQKKGDVSFVFQQPRLAPVSVWKNVDLVLPKGDNSKQIEQVLRQTGLADKKDSLPNQLSGGEQQRVSIARAFATNNLNILLDEPFSNLDYGTKSQLRKTFCNILQQHQTVVFVTHDIDDALALADRIYLLENKPASIKLVAEIAQPRNTNQFDKDLLQLKSKLQQLLQ